MSPDLWSALVVFIVLCASAAIGAFIRPRLPQHHRERETVEAMHLMITMLVTFAGLVLGLMIASAKTGYNQADQDSQRYAFQLENLHQCLYDYGPDTAAARAIIENYTAAMIASTWPDEPKPTGVHYTNTAGMPRAGESPKLSLMLDQLNVDILHLVPANAYQASVLQNCGTDYRDTIQTRWSVIEDVTASISTPFYFVLVCWLTIVFMTFGLVSPRNGLAVLGIALSAISISLAVFVIDDLSHPYGGLFAVPSTYTRVALAHMLVPGP